MKPYGFPALCRVVSTVVVGLAVWLGSALLPIEKLGELDASGRALVALTAAALWLLLQGALPGLLVREEGIHPAFRRRTEQRLGLAAVGVSIALLLPLFSYDWARTLWRSRFLLLVYVVATVALLAVMLLRGELTQLCTRRLRTASGTLAFLGAVACVLVLCAESILDWTLFRELRFVPDHASVSELAGNFTLNALLVASALGFVWGVTDRMGLAVLATGSTYVGLACCNALKLGNLKQPVGVLDFFYLSELGGVLSDFLPGHWLGPAAAVGLAVFVATLRLAHPFAGVGAQGARLGVALVALVVFAGVARLASLEPRARATWLPWQSPAVWDARQASLAEGMLLHLLGSAFTARVPEPADYSGDVLERIRRGIPDGADGAWTEAPSVVFLMVESWMDPSALPVTFSHDPTPELRRLMARQRHGHVRSPVFGSGSANAEFELLTGLSMEFLPPGSLPYRQYIRRELPALPRLFRDNGHRAVGLLVDPPSYFDRPTAYPHLGFEEVMWLSEEPGVQRDAADRGASDQAVAERILEILAGEEKAFVFAFTNATHAPYSMATFPGSELVVTDAPTPAVGDELGGYANALAGLDRAVGHLTRGLAALDEKTLLVILGDHVPPLESFDELGWLEGPQRARRMHEVPILLWSNFELPPGELRGAQNRVAFEVLEGLGLAPNPLFTVMGTGSDEERRLVQYDVLFGTPYVDWF